MTVPVNLFQQRTRGDLVRSLHTERVDRQETASLPHRNHSEVEESVDLGGGALIIVLPRLGLNQDALILAGIVAPDRSFGEIQDTASE